MRAPRGRRPRLQQLKQLSAWRVAVALAVVAVVAGWSTGTGGAAAQHLGDDCADLEGEAADRCCALAVHTIVTQTEAAVVEALATTDTPGDVQFALLTTECINRKRRVMWGPCRGVKRRVHHTVKFCTHSPFTDEDWLRKRDFLPQPPPAPQKTVQECRGQRFLLWSRNIMDFMAGHSHKWFSMSCALWEAYSLNRTLVLDTFVGMNKQHSSLHHHHADVPYPAWYNMAALNNLPRGGGLYHDFLRGCGAPGVLQEELGDVAVLPSGASHADMLARAHVPLLVRHWAYDELDPPKPQYEYGYQVCHRQQAPSPGFPNLPPEPGVNYTMPKQYGGLWYADWVYDTVKAIWAEVHRSGKPVACLHVRRGDKVSSRRLKWRYPNLDYDTSPAGILATIEPFVPKGSALYIATNEPDPVSFFEPLREAYEVHTLAHMTQVLDMSAYLTSTLGIVDYTVLEQCWRVIPTFANEKSRGFAAHVSLSKNNK